MLAANRTKRLEMLEPTSGVHKYSKKQAYYESVHMFMKARRWQPINEEEDEGCIGGTTWLELLIAFDVGKYRSSEDRLASSEAAVKRALARNKRRTIAGRSCIAKVSLKNELKCFKNVVRYIANKDVAEEQQQL